MWFKGMCLAAIFLVVTVLSVKSYGGSDNSGARAQSVPAVDQLPATCQNAKTAFVPRTKADLRKVKATLQAAVRRLNARMNASGTLGNDWRAYLKWDAMQKQMGRDDDADLRALDMTYARLAARHKGLEVACFSDVRTALRRYLRIARAVRSPEQKVQYEALMDALASQLEKHGKDPSPESALAIGTAVGWLEDVRHARRLVRAIRHHFYRSNLFIRVSDDVVGAGMAGPVDETMPLTDYILGTTIHGTAHTTGEISVELVPNPEIAVIDVIFDGTTKSTNVGYHRPVSIYSRGVTQTASRKRFLIGSERIEAHPAVTAAATSTKIDGVQSNRGRRMVERLAWKRICRDKGTAEYIASCHAEERVNSRIDEQAADLVARANEAYLDKFRKPLLQRRMFPRKLRFSTTRDAIRVTALQGDEAHLAASGAPPKTIEHSDLAIQVHESMVNNLATSGLSGVTLREAEFTATLTDLFGPLPKAFQPEEGRDPWGISFAHRHPISIVFADGGFKVTLRARRYFRGAKKHPGMNVTAAYKIEKSDQGFKAVRQGELAIFPPGFVPGSGNRLSARQQVIRNLLERRFGKIFTEELVTKNLELPGKWSKAGELSLTQLEANHGWLVMAWKRVPRVKSEIAMTGSNASN